MLAALALSALPACSDPRAGTLPPPSATAGSLSVRPSITAPTDKPEIEVAVRAYYAALEQAVHDPAEKRAGLEALIDPACPCREILEVLAKEAERGRRVDYTLRITKLSVPDASATRGTAQVTVAQSAGRLYDSSGRVVETISPLTEDYFVEVRRSDGTWRVRRVTKR